MRKPRVISRSGFRARLVGGQSSHSDRPQRRSADVLAAARVAGGQFLARGAQRELGRGCCLRCRRHQRLDTDIYSCDETTGRLKGASGFLVQSALDFIEALRLAAWPIFIWAGTMIFISISGPARRTRRAEELRSLFEINPRFAEGEDNLAFDLSLQGCLKANQKFRTGNKTYYFTLVTRATHEEGLPFGP